jgi:hypothetical protein
MIGSSPELVEFEIGIYHFWLAVNDATSEIEKGTDPPKLSQMPAFVGNRDQVSYSMSL